MVSQECEVRSGGSRGEGWRGSVGWGWGWGAGMAAAGMLTTSCMSGLAAGVWAAEIRADQLTGRWTSGSGTSLTFREDHTFASVRPAGMPAASHCDDPSVLASGRWAFEVFPEEGGFGTPDEDVTRGSALAAVCQRRL